MSDILLSGVVMGLVATAAMDAWAQALHRTVGVAKPNWGMAGRWVANMPGRVVHDDIGAAEPVPAEVSIGWVFHYGVGVAYGIILAAFMGPLWLAAPTLMPAWIFAILTIGLGWFFMQPSMGAGIAAANTPHPWRARLMGLAAHSVFGVGLWVGALVLA